jgi:hypothetical protein
MALRLIIYTSSSAELENDVNFVSSHTGTEFGIERIVFDIRFCETFGMPTWKQTKISHCFDFRFVSFPPSPPPLLLVFPKMNGMYFTFRKQKRPLEV